MRVLLAATLLLATTVNRAAAGGVDAKVIGWTADGARFLYVPPGEGVGAENDMGKDGWVTYGVVLDGRTGFAAQKYVIDVSGEPLADEKAELAKLPNHAAWKALLKAEKPKCAGSGRTGPDGLTVEAQARGKHMKGRWEKSVDQAGSHGPPGTSKLVYGFYFDSGDDEKLQMQEKSGAVTLQIARGGVKVESASWAGTSSMGEAGGGFSGEVRACFSPNGKRVAWIVRRAPSMMRDTGDVSVLIGATGLPRVQLVADKAVLATAAPKVGAALDAAGWFATDAHASNEATPRAATVIYFAKGFEAEARKLAAAMPGGATVGVLDWRAPFELIVGIGAATVAALK